MMLEVCPTIFLVAKKAKRPKMARGYVYYSHKGTHFAIENI